MNRSNTAEWLLSLAMEPSQAASVIGDLLEAGGSRGSGWFWSNVVRTLIGAAWQDFREHPFLVAGLATLGVLMKYSLSVAVGIVASFASLAFGGNPTNGLIGAAVTALAALYAGRWITRYSFNKDLAVCGAMVFIEPLIGYGWIVLFAMPALLRGDPGLHTPSFLGPHEEYAISVALYPVGAALGRRRWRVGDVT